MTPQQWALLIGTIFTIISTVTAWGFATGRWTAGGAIRLKRLEDDLHELKASLNERFADQRLTQQQFDENRREHNRFNKDLDGLKRRHNER